MNLPGFTAEASLHVTTRRFHSSSLPAGHTEAITPQAKAVGKPCTWYHFTCRDCVGWDDDGSCNQLGDPYDCPQCI